MNSWGQFTAAAPALGALATDLFTSHQHHVIASIRSDGSPRVGGTNVFFHHDDLWIGMMPVAARVGDLRRDPRCSIHSAPLDPELVRGDLRINAVAEEPSADKRHQLLDGQGSENSVVFTLGIHSVSLVRVVGDELVIDSWSPDHGVVTVRHSS